MPRSPYRPRALRLLVPSFLILVSGAASAEPSNPALGLEMELPKTSVLRHDPSARQFVSVLEKTPGSFIFETVGRAPDFENWPLFRVTSDNAHSRSQVSTKAFFGTLAFDPAVRPAKRRSHGTVRLSVLDEGPALPTVGIVELATGPLPYDPYLHSLVRTAADIFKSALSTACEEYYTLSIAKEVIYPPILIPDTAILDEYNRQLESYFHPLESGPGNSEEHGAALDWKKLLQLKSAKTPGDGSTFYFSCKQGATSGPAFQATAGYPLSRVSAKYSDKPAASAIQALVQGLVPDGGVGLSTQAAAELQGVLMLWSLNTQCADQRSRVVTDCRAKNYMGCTLVCDKNTIIPLPHGDVCALYQRLRPDLGPVANLIEQPSFLTGALLGTTPTTQWTLPADKTALLTPIAASDAACRTAWGESGYSNHDATLVPPLELRTEAGIELGVALEFRHLEPSQVGRTLRPEMPAGTFFTTLKSESGAPDITCRATAAPSRRVVCQ